ncbi:hypothetical protein [Halobacteriovorax sp.]|uniref:hypothetical protein n=1 Tax=Halobacteriovorax sp. TaxID=2020862 RepID=UPI003AF30A7C
MKSPIDKRHLSSKQEEVFLTRLINLCGKENFRPKLDHIRSYLSLDRKAIEEKSKVIIIGGTNGKGETSHCLNALLNSEGLKSCLWTSPHVNSITERFRYCSSNISIEELIELLDKYEEDIIRLQLSFYEALFVLFIKYAVSLDIEYLILEVGLGGRFDATNIFTKPVAAITSIGLDHTQILGSTLKEILFEKYGITRISGRLFENIEQKFLKDILCNWCDRDSINCTSVSNESETDFQVRNRQMAMALFSHITGITNINDDFKWPITPGRGDHIDFGEFEFTFFGAHNLLGHQKLLQSLNDTNKVQYDVLISFSSGRQDQIKSILKLYKTYPCIVKSVNILEFQHERALSSAQIKKELQSETKVYEMHNFLDTILGINEEIESNKYSASSTADMSQNIQLQTRNILVVGSYYFIADMQKYFNIRK